MLSLHSISKNLFKVIFVAFLTLTLITVYTLIGPTEVKSTYNFRPYPTINPGDLPDNTSTKNSCLVTAKQCTKTDDCHSCDTGTVEFDCTPITDSNKSQYDFHKTPLQPNKSYCLPSIKEAPRANQYTSKYVWTDDGVSQKWDVQCLYPDMYDDPASGCTNQKVCVNTSEPSKVNGFNKNQYKLVGTSGVHAGKQWDPIIEHDDDAHMRISPYSINASGGSIFACNCNSIDTSDMRGLPYTTLPNDPYTCHLDSCWKNNSYAYHGLINESDDPVTTGCDPSKDKCDCKCENNGGLTILHGKDKGKCVPSVQVCKEIPTDQNLGSWDNDKQSCNCQIDQANGAYSRTCLNDNIKYSDLTKVQKDKLWPCDPASAVDQCYNGTKCITSETPGLSFCGCQSSENVMGSECITPCSPVSPCLNNGTCLINNDGTHGYSCKCLEPVLQPDSTRVGCDGKKIGFTYGGKNCESILYNQGTVIKKQSTPCTLLKVCPFPWGTTCELNTSDTHGGAKCTGKSKYIKNEKHRGMGGGYETRNLTCK